MTVDEAASRLGCCGKTSAMELELRQPVIAPSLGLGGRWKDQRNGVGVATSRKLRVIHPRDQVERPAQWSWSCDRQGGDAYVALAAVERPAQ